MDSCGKKDIKLRRTDNYIFQYKVLFYLSWTCLYLIFPAWISSHSILQGKGFSGLSDPFARSSAIMLLIIYFSISSYLMNRYFRSVILNSPVIIKISDWSGLIRDNLWLVAACFLSIVFHIHSLYSVEIGYVEQGLWMYDFFNRYWHRLFDFPIQYGFWALIITLILIIKKNESFYRIFNHIYTKLSVYKLNNPVKLLIIFVIFVFFSIYSFSYPYSLEDSLQLLRFPPVPQLIYLFSYLGFGVSPSGPRIIQLIFYILSSVYIYRAINLFRDRETALLGATIYLFSPIIFYYASMTFFASGTVFFMILISFYFLKYIKDGDYRDLILTSYFISMGFMYKRVILVMFIICFIYLMVREIRKRDWHSFIDFKILMLALISVLPFMIIGRSSGLNYYYPIWSRLISFNDLMVYFLMIKSQISLIILVLFLISYILILFLKRDELSLFFGLFFATYYLFITIPKNSEFNHRYAMALYPAIAVFLAQFIRIITGRIRWKHSFKVASVMLIIYLIFICLVPRSSSKLITFKYKDFEAQLYPIKEAADWIRKSTNNDDKVLSLFIPNGFQFYIERIYADGDEINRGRFIYYRPSMDKNLIYPFQILKEFCYENKISYIMFPFGPNNYPPDSGASKEAKYLKEYSDKELIEVAKFNHEDNYILIYKIKKSLDLKE